MFVSFIDPVSHIIRIRSLGVIIHSHDHDGSLSQSLMEEKNFKTNFNYSFNDETKVITDVNWISDCDKYLQSNLTVNNADYLKEWAIFPSIYMDITGSKTNEITQLFKEVMPETCDNGGVILVKYNSRNHASFLCGLKKLTEQRSFDNRITIFNTDSTSIINIRVTESGHLKDVLKEVGHCAEDSKDMITLIKFLSSNNQIENGKNEIHNIVCAINIDGREIVNKIDNIEYLCAGCISSVIPKEYLASKNGLNSWLSENVRPFLDKDNVDWQKNRKEFLKIIGHITCYMAKTSIKIVASSEFLHDHNVIIQLNNEQTIVAVSPMKHKLIKGGYGVGKTIIGILNLEYLATNCKC